MRLPVLELDAEDEFAVFLLVEAAGEHADIREHFWRLNPAAQRLANSVQHRADEGPTGTPKVALMQSHLQDQRHQQQQSQA
jgi:hypothetical protein